MTFHLYTQNMYMYMLMCEDLHAHLNVSYQKCMQVYHGEYSLGMCSLWLHYCEMIATDAGSKISKILNLDYTKLTG